MPLLAEKMPSSAIRTRDGNWSGLELADLEERNRHTEPSRDGEELRVTQPGNSRLSVLTVAAALMVPISVMAELMGLHVGGMSLALRAHEYWITLAIIAAVGIASGSRQAVSSSEQAESESACDCANPALGAAGHATRRIASRSALR